MRWRTSYIVGVVLVLLAMINIYAYLVRHPIYGPYLRLYWLEVAMKEFRKGTVTSHFLDEAKRDYPALERVQIIDNVLYMSNQTDYRHVALRYLLYRILQNQKLPNVDVLVNLHDSNIIPKSGPQYPVLSFYQDDKFWDFSIPNPCHFFWSLQYYELGDGRKQWPFEEREPKLFWRGTTTGGFYTHENWRQFARSKLVLLSQERPDLIDAGFVECSQCEAYDVVPLVKPVSIRDQLRYRYQILVDGNTAPSSRSLWTLYSGAVTLKQDSPFEEFFYNRLKPYKHFIPVKADLSDLVDQLQWAELHPADALRIAKASAELIEESLTPSHLNCYFVSALRLSAELLSAPPTEPHPTLGRVSAPQLPRYCW